MERYRANYNANISPAPPPPNNFHLPPKPPLASLIRRIDDAEISIFDAERYFNEADQDDTLKKKTKKKKKNITLNGDGSTINHRDSSVSSGDGSYGRNIYFRTRSSRASTPTASSEASWNSQTGLLAKPRPGSAGVSAKESRKGSSSSVSASTSSSRFRKFFGRHCPCHGKKSVEVEEYRFSGMRSSTRSHNHSSNAKPPDETIEMTKFRICATEPAADIGRRIMKSGGAGSFSFPVLISPVTVMVPPLAKEFEEPVRASLEVFRPSVELMNSSPPTHDEGVASDSDTSSDLFELESLSEHSSAAYRRCRRDYLDELPKFATVIESMAPSECHAPSEASVEWSVTTAEGGFDRTSVANLSIAAASEDCREVRSARTEKEVRFDSAATPARNEGGAVKKRGGDGGLLNCGCDKAVSVSPDPVRFVPDQHCPL